MTAEPIVFFILIFAIFILSIGFSTIALTYAKILAQLTIYKENEGKQNEESQKQATALLETAKNQSYEIIEQANRQASEIISKAHVFNEENKKMLDTQVQEIFNNQAASLVKTSQEMLDLTQKVFNQVTQQNINLLKNITNSIEQEAGKQIKEFQDILHQETIASHKSMESKLQEDYEKANQDIAVYKEEQLKKLEDSLYEIIVKTTEIVLSKTLTLQQHHKLILESLEQAKKDNMFGT